MSYLAGTRSCPQILCKSPQRLYPLSLLSRPHNFYFEVELHCVPKSGLELQWFPCLTTVLSFVVVIYGAMNQTQSPMHAKKTLYN